MKGKGVVVLTVYLLCSSSLDELMVFYCLNTQGAHSAVTSYRIRSETLVGLVFCNRWSFCFRWYHMLNKRAMALYTCVEKGNKSATGFCSLRTASESWQNIWIPSSTCIVMCIFLIWHGLFWQPPNSLGGQILPHIWNQWPNYLLIHVHIAYMVWAFLPASEDTTASKQPRR